MNKKIVIGIDIGVSHITSAAVDIEELQIVQNVIFS
jgi:predicted NBD/HSP70 family sugar kinase